METQKECGPAGLLGILIHNGKQGELPDQATEALFSSKKFCKIEIVALSFVFDKYCPIKN